MESNWAIWSRVATCMSEQLPWGAEISARRRKLNLGRVLMKARKICHGEQLWFRQNAGNKRVECCLGVVPQNLVWAAGEQGEFHWRDGIYQWTKLHCGALESSEGGALGSRRMKVIWDPPFWKIDPISTCLIEIMATSFR